MDGLFFVIPTLDIYMYTVYICIYIYEGNGWQWQILGILGMDPPEHLHNVKPAVSLFGSPFLVSDYHQGSTAPIFSSHGCSPEGTWKVPYYAVWLVTVITCHAQRVFFVKKEGQFEAYSPAIFLVNGKSSITMEVFSLETHHIIS